MIMLIGGWATLHHVEELSDTFVQKSLKNVSFGSAGTVEATDSPPKKSHSKYVVWSLRIRLKVGCCRRLPANRKSQARAQPTPKSNRLATTFVTQFLAVF